MSNRIRVILVPDGRMDIEVEKEGEACNEQAQAFLTLLECLGAGAREVKVTDGNPAPRQAHVVGHSLPQKGRSGDE